MKRILGIAMVLGLMGALSVLAQEVKPGKVEVIDLGKDVKLEMVLIPAGKFMMGSPAFEKDRDKSQERQHEVTLTKPFYMGKYEVTQEQWESVMGNNPSIKTKGTKYPVTNVLWEDCQEFIKKLNAKTSGGYRLPTEAEWEYACRAGNTRAYSVGNGNEITSDDANYGYWRGGGFVGAFPSLVGKLVAVGSYKPNAFGLYDMHGNVREWCENRHYDYPEEAVTDPKGPKRGSDKRMFRGGAFRCEASMARSANRNGYEPVPARDAHENGFRLARTIDIKAGAALAVIKASGYLLVAPFTEAKAKELQKEEAKSLKKEVEEKEDLGKGVKLDLLLIPAGKFMMGSPESEKDRDKNERQHEVTITKPYYMGKYEVTQEQWEAVMGNNPRNNPNSNTKGAKLPVTNVSWYDCQEEFIEKLNAKTNGGYRLPTEAEWEYACRAGTITAHSYGDSITKNDANIEGRDEKAVGSYKPNAFGLYDMHGNAWEWCEDWYGDYPEGGVTDPKGPAKGEYRVLRGGAFARGEDTRSSLRGENVPGDRLGFGFRLVRTVDIQAGSALVIFNPKPAEIIPEVGNLLLAPFTEAKAKELQKEVAKSLKKEVKDIEDLSKDVKLEMILIPAGKFKMGSPESEKGRHDNERQHEVTLTKPFYMGKYEVTQEQYEAVIGNNPSIKTKGAKYPVTDVTWDDCHEFIKRLNAKTNKGYRLPTEAEWEYACRAGTSTAYSFGDSLTKADANYGAWDVGSIKPVGNYNPNAFGLYDMHGNAWEWCEDWFTYHTAEAVTDPKGPRPKWSRVSRGGSFNDMDWYARSSRRADLSPKTVHGPGHGFRLASAVDIKAAVAPTIPNPKPAEIIPEVGNLLLAPFTEAKAKELQKEVAKSLKKEVKDIEDLGKGINLNLVLIPAGKFMMGSPESEKGRSGNEKQHQVTLTKPFYMGKYEVTQEQWEAVMGSNPSNPKGVKLPVTNVSREDCQDFIKKLNAKTKDGYRLPTEAEWEYACRAGTTTAYSFGDSLTKSDTNIGGANLKAVGCYKPNAFGLYDMHGNVLEWCEDWYDDYPTKPVKDPKGPATGEYSVLRGGAFYDLYESSARSSNRIGLKPADRTYYFGFRLAKTP